MKLKFVTLLLGTAFSGQVMSFDMHENKVNSVYFGIDMGYQAISDDSYPKSPSGLIYALSGGLMFDRNWLWDFSYQFNDGVSADVSPINTVSVESKTIITNIGRYWRMNNRIDLYGKVGVSYYSNEKEETYKSKINVEGFSPIFHAGLNYKINNNFRLNLGYQYMPYVGKNASGKYDSSAVFGGPVLFF